jgi:hypothetical protein
MVDCPKCGGYRWFDDRGFAASGQPAFQFHPCTECNPKGELDFVREGENDGETGVETEDA